MMHRAAVMDYPDAAGEPLCRFVLERSTRPGNAAAWLLCNPSRASHEIDDPTAGRVVHHSGRAGYPRSLIGNVWPLRTPYPAELWAALKRGDLTAAMMQDNLEALATIGGQACIHVVAYGAEPGRRFPALVRAAVDAFTLGGRFPAYCLGTTDDGHPLHPLARGKFAIRNDANLRVFRQ